MAQTMLNNKTMVLYFLGDAVNPASHIQNIVVLRSSTNQTPYELQKNKKLTIKYYRIFYSRYYILRDMKNTQKFDSKSDEKIFLNYYSNSKVYRVYNLKTKTVMKSNNVFVDNISTKTTSKELKNINLGLM